MSQLIINFDSNLEIKPIEDRKKADNLTEQKTLNLNNPENFYSEYESTKNLIREDSCNGFVNTFLAAYNSHKPLRLRPDDINLALQLIWSICLNNNAEKFRSEFVNHQGKMELQVESRVFDSNFFCQQFANLMKQNVKNPEFIEFFTKEFTTTTQLIKTVTNQVLMNTLKEYFSCSMILGCGISKVIMEGTKEDWNKLSESYEYFKTFFANTELGLWFVHFDVIMKNLILMRNLQDSGEVEATNELKEFWIRVICYVPQGSGGQTILGGWVRLLTPYSSTNKIIGLEKPILCLDLSKKRPEYSRDYKQQDVLANYYAATGWSELQKSLIETPAKLFDYDGTEYDVEFVSGFYPPYERDDGSISTNIGFLMRTDKTIEKKKLQKYYNSLGVEIDTKRPYDIKIPRSLRKEQTHIMHIFDAYFSSLYGVDPEEEKRKEYLIENGVYLEKQPQINSSHISTTHIKVPEKFKENDQDKKNEFEKEVKDLFKSSKSGSFKIVYY
jgi:hypothetical protein